MPSYYARRASWRTPLFAALALLFLAPSAAAQNARAVFTATQTATPSAAERSLVEVVQDPSFEGGNTAGIWLTNTPSYLGGSPVFGTPRNSTIPDFARTGVWYALLGTGGPVVSDVYQDVEITAAGEGTLSFYLNSGSNAGSQSELRVFVDGDEVALITADDGPEEYTLYTYTYDFETAGTYRLRFEQTQVAGTPFTNWFIDDVSLDDAAGTTPDAITFMPDTVRAAAMTGMTASSSVTLMNSSDVAVDYSVNGFDGPARLSDEAMKTILSAPARRDYTWSPMTFAKGEADPRREQSALRGAGGPDAFGYTWIDSNEDGGPEYDFVDISATGTALGLDDDAGSPAQALPFSFSFYGVSYDQVFVNSNGWLSFTDPGAASGGADSRGNDPIPSAGVPNTIVAPLWDDLNPGQEGAGDVYIQDMGDGRVIVQWDDVPRYTFGGTGAFLTFQAILEANGEITFQYETVDLEGLTPSVGVENQDGTVGLEVAFNDDYLESGLAVRITSVPQFVSDVSPSSGTIPAGGSVTLDIDFEAVNLGGRYAGTLQVETDANDVAIPLVYEVTGTPVLELSGDIEFDDITQGFPGTATLTLTNTGDDVLTVSDVTSGDDAFSVDFDGPVEIAAGESFDVAVTFDPDGTGDFVSMITVTSDGGTVMVNVSGTANSAGEIAVTPDTLTATAESGETATATLTIANEGVGDLLFSFLGFDDDPGRQAQMKARYEAQFGRSLAPAATQKGAPDTFTGGLENYLRAGGPDAFGYVYSDSNEPGGPMYAFEDISETGTALAFTSTDDGSASVTLPFGFPFYGDTKTDMLVSTNGYLTFSGSGTDFSNDPIPSEAAPNDIIAPFWDDLAVNPVANEGSAVYTQDMGDGRLIVQFENERLGDPDGPTTLSFQVVLSESGVIEFRYRSLASADLASATVGIENADGTDGLEVSANEAGYLEDELAIRFVAIAPFVTSVDPVSGSVESNGTQEVTVTFDAAGLNAGVYSGNLIIENNDSSQSTLLVPVQFTVTGQPNIGTDAIDDALAFGVVVAGADSVRTLTITNDGTDVLTFNPLITKGIGQNNAFEFVSDEVETIAPGSSFGLDIRFAPDESGTYSATLVLQSNDPDSGNIEIALTGSAINAALPSVSVDDVDLEVIQGLTTTAEFTVSNDAAAGADALSFTVSIVQTDGPEAQQPTAPWLTQPNAPYTGSASGPAARVPGPAGPAAPSTARAVREGDVVTDGSFETTEFDPDTGLGTNEFWNAGSDNFGTPFCSGPTCAAQQPGLPAQLGRGLGLVWRHVPGRERLCRARSHGAFRQRRAHVLPPHPGAGRWARRHDGRAHGRRCAREL